MSISQVDKETLIKKLEKAYQLAEQASYNSCLEYLKHVVINTVPPRPFREVAEPWQWAIHSKVIPAIEFSSQVKKSNDGPMKFMFILPKGHDKTSMIGRLLNWSMFSTRHQLTAYAAAKDKEQASYLVDAMQTECHLNPWLKKQVNFKNWQVTGRNNSKLTVTAADAEGVAGFRGDLLVIDELSQWKKKDFFDQLMVGYHKRVNLDRKSLCTLMIITNAGVMNSWQWDVLQEAKRLMKEGKGWYVYEAPEYHHLASWMTKDKIDEQRRMIPSSLGKMLYDNVWIDPNENNEYVSYEQVKACEIPSLDSETSGSYFASIDYGPVKDRTVMCVVKKINDQIQVERMDVKQGSKEHHVPISQVESWIDEVRRIYPLELLVIDKYQMESTIQKYRGVVPIEVFEPRGSSTGNYAMAENLRHLITNHQVHWTPSCGSLVLTDGRIETLSDELMRVAVKVTPSGYRIHNPGKTHDDRVVALGMAALYAIKSSIKRNLYFNELWF